MGPVVMTTARRVQIVLTTQRIRVPGHRTVTEWSWSAPDGRHGAHHRTVDAARTDALKSFPGATFTIR